MYENEPRAIGGVLDAGIRLFRGGFAPVVTTAAKGFGVVFLLEVNFETAFGVSSASLNAADPEALDPASVVVYLALLPLTLAVSFLTTAAVVIHLHRIATGAAEAGAGVFRAALRRLLPYLGVSILYGLAVAVGLLLLVAPGVWLSISLLPAIYLVLTEPLGPIEALRRSFAIVRGNWWRAATVLLVTSLIVAVVQGGIAAVPATVIGVLAATGDGQLGTGLLLALNFLNAVAQALSIPLFTAMLLALVRDLLIRASGEDLEARLDAVGA